MDIFRKQSVLVTPNIQTANFQTHKTGDVEVLQSKENVPFLYPNAPEEKSIFQPQKLINVFRHDERLRSKSKSKYEQFLVNLQQKKVQSRIEKPSQI